MRLLTKYNDRLAAFCQSCRYLMKIPLIPKFDCSVCGNLPFLEVDTFQFTLLELVGFNHKSEQYAQSATNVSAHELQFSSPEPKNRLTGCKL